MKGWAIIMLSAFLAGSSFGYDERPVVPSGVPVQVRYQIKSVNSNSWSTNTATLKGSVSESMMVNELSRRHPNSQIRILAAACGKNISTVVRYQISSNGKSWSGPIARPVITRKPNEKRTANSIVSSTRTPDSLMSINSGSTIILIGLPILFGTI